jgi:hypothetical protein
MMLYGQFVGSWDGKVVVHRPDGERTESSCEVHFGWALGGRAVQDVWIVPSLAGRAPDEPDRMHGTTLRVYDPREDRWEITWIDPLRHMFDRMIGRASGKDIVQEYRNAEGRLTQWCFTGITGESFHWLSRESADGAAWRVTAEFFLKRREKPRVEGAPELRAFDFWLGTWRVTHPDTGVELGLSRVDSILGGRVLHEHWSGSDGYRGESFNVFDRDKRRWHQSWVGDNGAVLLLDGGFEEGAMDLAGRAPDGADQRIRWWPRPDGTVLQKWESSRDGGRTWECRFEGVYRRA